MSTEAKHFLTCIHFDKLTNEWDILFINSLSCSNTVLQQLFIGGAFKIIAVLLTFISAPSGLCTGNLRLPHARSGPGGRAFRPYAAREATAAHTGLCCQM